MSQDLTRACVIATSLLIASTGAWSQTYKCKGPDGKVTYIDRPCDGNTESEKLKIYTYPINNDLNPGGREKSLPGTQAGGAPVANERERRAKATQQPNEYQKRILEAKQKMDEATRNVERLHAENYDPQKCAAAKNAIAAMDKKYPLTANLEVGYSILLEEKNLYCGN